MIKAVVFDMDGVIFDSERLVIDCWRPIADKYQIKDIEKTCLACTGTNKDLTRKIMKETYGEDFPYDEYKAEVSALFHDRAKDGKLPQKPGVKELLAYLKQHDYKVAIASSTRQEIVRRELEEGGLIDFFDQIICGDMVSRSKPEPDIFLKACEALAVSPNEAYAIEDSYNGIRAAYAGGLHPVMVPDLKGPDDEMRAKTDYIFDSLVAFLDFLKGA